MIALMVQEPISMPLGLSVLLRLLFQGKGHLWECIRPGNLTVGCKKLYSSNEYWKHRYGCYKRSLSETVMYKVKQLLGGCLSFRKITMPRGGNLRLELANPLIIRRKNNEVDAHRRL